MTSLAVGPLARSYLFGASDIDHAVDLKTKDDWLYGGFVRRIVGEELHVGVAEPLLADTDKGLQPARLGLFKGTLERFRENTVPPGAINPGQLVISVDEPYFDRMSFDEDFLTPDDIGSFVDMFVPNLDGGKRHLFVDGDSIPLFIPTAGRRYRGFVDYVSVDDRDDREVFLTPRRLLDGRRKARNTVPGVSWFYGTPIATHGVVGVKQTAEEFEAGLGLVSKI